MPVSLLVSIGLAVVIAAATVGFTSRSRSAKTAVLGLGWTALPIGLWLTGLTDLTINGVRSLIDWFQRTSFTTATAWGLGLLVGGIVFVIVGAMLPKKAPAARPQAKPVAGGQRPQVAAPSAAPTKPVQAPAAKPAPKQAQAKGLDPEDAEIEELLRKRGIM
ncbi:MAG: hypothetical protein QM713_03320 [Arachnia sp.]